MSLMPKDKKAAKGEQKKTLKPEYLLPIEQVFRPLHPSKRAQEGAQRAFETLRKNYPSLIAKSDPKGDSSAVQPNSANPTYRHIGKYPPAKPGALGCEPLKAATGSLTRPQYLLAA